LAQMKDTSLYLHTTSVDFYILDPGHQGKFQKGVKNFQ
jgi:hypothetical protein